MNGSNAAYLGVGASGIGTEELDDRLAERGYPTFGSSALALNVGAHVILPAGASIRGPYIRALIGIGWRR